MKLHTTHYHRLFPWFWAIAFPLHHISKYLRVFACVALGQDRLLQLCLGSSGGPFVNS